MGAGPDTQTPTRSPLFSKIPQIPGPQLIKATWQATRREAEPRLEHREGRQLALQAGHPPQRAEQPVAACLRDLVQVRQAWQLTELAQLIGVHGPGPVRRAVPVRQRVAPPDRLQIAVTASNSSHAPGSSRAQAVSMPCTSPRSKYGSRPWAVMITGRPDRPGQSAPRRPRNPSVSGCAGRRERHAPHRHHLRQVEGWPVQPPVIYPPELSLEPLPERDHGGVRGARQHTAQGGVYGAHSLRVQPRRQPTVGQVEPLKGVSSRTSTSTARGSSRCPARAATHAGTGSTAPSPARPSALPSSEERSFRQVKLVPRQSPGFRAFRLMFCQVSATRFDPVTASPVRRIAGMAES